MLEVARAYDERAAGVATQPIHGDCHVGNLLRGDEGWFFLDFDDMVVGPAVQDVWMLLPGRDAEAERQRRVLVDAYREFRSFDERSLALVEPLRALRFVSYAGWIARRWGRSLLPRRVSATSAPTTTGRRRTRDLEEQLERIAWLGADGAIDAQAGAGEDGDGAASGVRAR